MSGFEQREGELRLDVDPATRAPDGGIVYIGYVSSAWTERADCPKNMARALQRGVSARINIGEPYRQGLQGLENTSHVIILTWLDRSPRDLIVQRPRHAPSSKGVFALRSPVRPNPVGLHVAPVTAVDVAGGTIELAGIDVLDGTPVIDIKPYLPAVDAFAEADPGHAGSDRK